jgi:hypothetical protein
MTSLPQKRDPPEDLDPTGDLDSTDFETEVESFDESDPQISQEFASLVDADYPDEAGIKVALLILLVYYMLYRNFSNRF